MKLKDIVFAIAIVCIWGLNAAIGKIAIMQMPTFLFLSIRFLITATIFLPFAKVNKSELKSLFKIAFVLNVLHYGFVFASMRYLDASSLGVIQQIQVPIAFLLGMLLLKEKISKDAVLGISLSFAGVIVVLGIPTLSFLGFLLAFLGSIMWAFANIEMKRLKQINPYTFISYTCLFSVPFLLSFSFLFEDISINIIKSPNWLEVLLVLIYQVILCSFSMIMWQRILSRNPSSSVVPFTLLQPIFAIIGGIIFFQEILHINLFFGGLLTSLGLYLTIKTPKNN